MATLYLYNFLYLDKKSSAGSSVRPRLVGTAPLPAVKGTDGDISPYAAKTRARMANPPTTAGETETASARVPNGAGKPEETT